jgi:SAM-dependent methyltransferase
MEPVRTAYGAMSAQYIELFGTSEYMHADDLALITRHLSIRAAAVLDVGCGPGHLTEHLRLHDVDATGIDLVPEFIDHARATFPDGKYAIGSMHELHVPDHSVAGILAWYSLIHLPPDSLDRALCELRRAIAPAGTLVTGFFDGNKLEAFEHKVVTAHRWPIDELAARLQRAGFTEVERHSRRCLPEVGLRSHAAIVAIAN